MIVLSVLLALYVVLVSFQDILLPVSIGNAVGTYIDPSIGTVGTAMPTVHSKEDLKGKSALIGATLDNVKARKEKQLQIIKEDIVHYKNIKNGHDKVGEYLDGLLTLLVEKVLNLHDTVYNLKWLYEQLELKKNQAEYRVRKFKQLMRDTGKTADELMDETEEAIEAMVASIKATNKKIRNQAKMMKKQEYQKIIDVELAEYAEKQQQKADVRERTMDRKKHKQEQLFDDLETTVKAQKKSMEKLLQYVEGADGISAEQKAEMVELLGVSTKVMEEHESLTLDIVEKVDKQRALDFGTPNTDEFKCMYYI